MFDTILRNAKVYLSEKQDFSETDLGIKNGKIEAITKLPEDPNTEDHDFSGHLIIPGVIDSQVHFREPGPTHKEDLEHGSKGAALGGVTTFCEMPNTNPSTTTVERLLEKVDIAKEKCLTDFRFFMGATADNIDQLKHCHEIPECCGIKIFLGSSTGDLLLDNPTAIERIFRETRGPIAIHSENERRLVERKSVAYENNSVHDHPRWRDVETALSATKMVIELAKKCQRKVHILHISTAEEMEFLAQNKDHCTVEVLPQHLTLAAPECYDLLDTLAQMNPPIREARHREGIWQALQEGVVDIIGSDHAPHTLEEKQSGYPKTPSGMPGVQTLLPIMMDHINQGKLNWQKLLKLICEAPADLYSMNDRGRIAIGKRADLTIIDPNLKWTIKNSWMASKCGWTPYHGHEIHGKPTQVLSQGRFIVRDEKLNP